MSFTELRRALAVDAVGPALNKHGAWLPDHVRQAVADAVLAAIELAPAETQATDGDGGGCALPGWMACDCNHIDGCQHPAAPADPAARYAADVECAIGLNIGNNGGSQGVEAARDAVLNVRDTELQQLRAQVARVRKAVADMHGTDGARHWARWLDSVLNDDPDPDRPDRRDR